jgi:beta-1,4-N-acetylglucosaminyltransferase
MFDASRAKRNNQPTVFQRQLQSPARVPTMPRNAAREKNTDSNRRVFVTVGTTSFDALIQTLDSPTVCASLKSKGYDGLTMQIGRGVYKPRRIAKKTPGFDVKIVDYLPSIEDELRDAALVISHAGAGSVFETLKFGKPLLVVVNKSLMDNHQKELAMELEERGHVRWCVPEGLRDAIGGLAEDGSGFEFERYEPGACTLGEVLDDLLF